MALDCSRNEKPALRRELRARRAAMDPAERAAASAAIVRTLAALPECTSARRVLLYCAFGGEPDIAALSALLTGAEVCYPAVGGAPGELLVVPDTGRFVANRWGIPEPVGGKPLPSDAVIDVAVIPGIAFDRAGYRLGYGGGYYDRLLAGGRVRWSVGVCYDELLADALPRGPHDVPVRCVITEHRTICPIGGTTTA